MANEYSYEIGAEIKKGQMANREWPDKKKSGMAIVGVAKFLGCEKTLVKNPSEAVGPY